MKRFFSYVVVATIVVVAALAISSCEDEVKYTIRFDSKGGTPTPPEQILKTGSRVSKPADPIRENHTFTGWATADNATSPLWNFETETVTGDMTLFARWAIKTYLVTFDSNGGSAVSAQNVAHNSAATKPANPTRNGYEFDGWFNGDTEWNFGTAITAPVTLKAKWTMVHIVTFDSDGGSAVPTLTIRNGNTAPRPANPTKTIPSGLYLGTPTGNYFFNGWYNGDTEWDFSTPITAPITLKARWILPGSALRIESVLPNDIAASVAYVNANSNRGEEYTLLIGTNVSVGEQKLNAANAKLTIIGLGAERIISASNKTLFIIDGNNTTNLTLGQNITLKYGGGVTYGTNKDKTIIVRRGILSMGVGSKITETAFGAICIDGINAIFKMGSGEICGNNTHSFTGGVYVCNGGIFEFSGGTITDNNTYYSNDDDLFIDYGCSLRLSGDARIGVLTLNANNTATRSTVTITGNYSGTVARLNLRGENINTSTVATWWTNVPVILNGTISIIQIFNNGLGDFLNNLSITSRIPISATHTLNASGILVLKEK